MAAKPYTDDNLVATVDLKTGYVCGPRCEAVHKCQ